MKKHVTLLSSLSAAFLFVACGDDIENNTINQMGMEVVASEDDLPECSDENEGDQAFVKDEDAVRVCVGGKWKPVLPGGSGNSDLSCKTVELKDKSGLKIVCNGDSIGVVLNGSDGKDGKDGSDGEDGKAGTGCAMTEKTESTVTVECGDSTIVIDLGAGVNGDTLELDSEKVAISLDSVAGYSQKGPFLKGSSVYLYELGDGRTLKQTNGNFTSIITRDDGRYRFTARDLASQYAMIVVDGYYRNEVTGEPSKAPIRLRALTDMRKRSDANINLLTHLEFDRVYYLVTREHKTVKQAKKQAQAEIFDAFHIDTTGFSKSSEDLDVFGSSDADAALLAISIMLQGNRDETALMVLLTEISDDIATDGKWDDAEKRAEIAGWVFENEFFGKIAGYRSNVEEWGLSTMVPDFEKYVHQFWYGELGKCSDINEDEWVELPWRNIFTIMKCVNGVWTTHAHVLKDSRDGQDYGVIRIGDQVWMAENLNFKTGSSYCYKDEDSNCTKYGRLYRWVAAVGKSESECGYGYTCSLPSGNIQGVCPSGWHLPSKAEWETLFNAVGIQSTAGKVLKATSGWNSSVNGTDAFGFSAFPAGYSYNNGGFLNEGNGAYFWSSTEGSSYSAYGVDLRYDDAYARLRDDYYKSYGFSVRCLQD